MLKRFSLSIFFIICFSIFSSTAVFSETPETIPQESQTQKTVSETVPETIPETIPEKNYENLMKIKDSTSKFPAGLLATIAGAVILLLSFKGYLAYKKFKNKSHIVSAPLTETLETPKDFKTAINLFLGKTDE